MEPLSEYLAITSNRENLYQLLARLYKVEVDQAFLEQMSGMRFPVECGDNELNTGYRLLENYLRHRYLDPVTDLAVDYAKVFLGAGVSKEDGAAYPYESVYTSPKRLVMQDARDHVVAVYRAKGLDKDESFDVPEDHVALEFEFMAHLCRDTRQALSERDWASIAAGLTEQKNFLSQHILNWVPAFCNDIRKYAGTDFYKAVAHVTSGYLRMDRAILDDLLAEASGARA